MKKVLLALLLAASPAAADVDISLSASPASVSVGNQSVVSVYCDNPGTEFNTYSMTISWDPAKVSYVSTAEGSYMTGICGNTFIQLDTSDVGNGNLGVVHSLLCLNAYCGAQGNVLHVTFEGEATGTSAVTVSDPEFRRSGNHVTVGDVTGASIQVTGQGQGGDPCYPTPCEIDKQDYPFQTTWGRAKRLFQ